jgi:hypothetical protein
MSKTEAGDTDLLTDTTILAETRTRRSEHISTALPCPALPFTIRSHVLALESQAKEPVHPDEILRHV